jgi:hypothetical protein
MSVARGLVWINSRHGWRTICWAGLLALFAAALSLLPLFDVLGYDFSFALGLLTALAGVDIGHGTVVAARRLSRRASPLRLAYEATVATVAALALPLLISIANGLRVRNCNLAVGLAFFALLPLGTAVIAAGMGTSLAVVIPRRRLARVLVFGLPVMSAVWALVRLYREPAVFVFDPFGGYFPGPIYDEALRPPLRLLWYRLANLTWVAAALASATWIEDVRAVTGAQPATGPRHPMRRLARAVLGVRPWHRSVLPLVLLVASLAWFCERGRLGFQTRRSDLARLLPRETRTRHFVLRTDPASDSDAQVALAQDDLEYQYATLVTILGVEPTTPITVYRFPSAQAKKDAVGAAQTLFAKPWTREIFVQAERFPAHALRHEMAHVFAAAFGDPVFGIALAWHFVGPVPVPRLAMGLVEGLAVAADFAPPYGRSTRHQEAAAMIALGQAPELARALGAGFTVESGARAYTLAGSFCRFLLDRFGPEKLRRLYRTAGDFTGSYGRDLASLEKDWRTFLAGLPADDSSRAQAEEEFRRPAIFRKVCARELAARVSDGFARMGTAPGTSVSLFASACEDDPSEPTYRLDLAEALIANQQGDQALATLREVRASGALTRALRVRAAIMEAGIRFRSGQLAEARDALEAALREVTDDGDERLIRVCLRALRDPAAQRTLGRAFLGDERGRPTDAALVVFLVDRFAQDHPDEALGPYLLGKQLLARDAKLAQPLFAEACRDDNAREPALEPVLLKECKRALGESAYLAGDLTTSRAAFTWLVDHADYEVERARARDFLRRIAWKNSH